MTTDSIAHRLALFVGGEPDSHQELAAPLAEVGCVLKSVESAHRARLLLAGVPDDAPDLILIDLGKSRTRRLGLLRWLRTREETNRTPVIVLCGDDAEKDIQSAIAAGAEAYLVRPILRAALMGCVKGVLKNAPAPRRAPNLTAPEETQERSDYPDELTTTAVGLSATDEFHSSEWALFKAIEAGIGRCLRSNSPLSVVMMGVKTNETVGADEQDVFLTHVSWRARSALSKAAALKLFDSDVFCCVLPDADEAEAIRVVKNMKTVIEDRPFAVAGRVAQANVSFGVTVIEPPFVHSPFKLIDWARQALDRAAEKSGVGFWVHHTARTG